MNTILFLLACYGGAFILIEPDDSDKPDIFSPIRKLLVRIPLIGTRFLKKGFTCWFCSGGYTAFLFYLLLFLPSSSFPQGIVQWLSLMGDAALHVLAGAAASYFIAMKLSDTISFTPIPKDEFDKAASSLTTSLPPESKT